MTGQYYNKKVALCIPTYNAGMRWSLVLDSINIQTCQPEHKIIIDSGSTDWTVALAKDNNFDVITISAQSFDHGKARQMLVESHPNCDIYIFMTQDAILADPKSFLSLRSIFDNSKIGMAYGRQLPHFGASVFESHARLFNYPQHDQIRGIDQITKYGFKTIFCSNSYSAYRSSALKDVEGFPTGNIMGEDTLVASRMIQNGWEIAYVSTSIVYHSHSYTLIQEFKRYFDTGVFHAQNRYLYKLYGRPTGEGVKFIKSEIAYCLKTKFWLVILIVPKTLMKWLGFKLGLKYRHLPITMVKSFSMHTNYWRNKDFSD